VSATAKKVVVIDLLDASLLCVFVCVCVNA